jgi:hypothetical protein
MPQIDEVVEALKRPRAYPEGVEEIDLIQTHISYVFLTGRYVYKVKKPVDFEFLDFTTLEKRKFFCEEEVRLNRRLSPGIYLGVVSIVLTPAGEIRVEGEGKIIEYAVKMKQLPQEAIMTRLLERGEVSPQDVETIAETLVPFHRGAATGEGVDRYGSLDQVAFNWVQNFDQTRALRGNLIDERAFDLLEERILGFLEERKGLFERRVREGRIRECHGDLHSGNIFLLKDGAPRIYLFDAIEFNPAFRCSDVASEIAFLSMDLEFFGREDLSQAFVKRYLALSDDEELLTLLPFYQCYRAYVRAKVIGFTLADERIPEEEKKRAGELTQRYHSLALRYAEEL